jgi:hypothetical protein
MLDRSQPILETPLSKEFGDFPTPDLLVAQVLQRLQNEQAGWTRVLEPTCGSGNFIRGLLALEVPPQEIQAIELNPLHFRQAQAIPSSQLTRITMQQAKLFDLNLQALQWRTSGRLLVIGNPPWVTNAALGELGSDNLPTKNNFKRMRGIDARTGAANFDLTEYIWFKLINELAMEQPTIALLCKTSTARRVLHFAWESGLLIDNISIRKINAQQWFGVAVSACLLRLDVGRETSFEAKIYADLLADEPEVTIGFIDGQLIPDISTYQKMAWLVGKSSRTWRQGLKHDAAGVMELRQLSSDIFQNKLGETMTLEPEYVYPLLKGSDVFHGRQPTRSVIVTQKRLGDDTAHLKQTAPKLWQYLNAHITDFTKRKSSIYQNQPAFAMFGIGDYAFAPYKVGISGLHKVPKFCVIAPVDDRPVMLDDTCYFLPCNSLAEATHFSDLLNSDWCMEFLRSRLFSDAKRPITKKLLQLINLEALLGMRIK